VHHSQRFFNRDPCRKYVAPRARVPRRCFELHWHYSVRSLYYVGRRSSRYDVPSGRGCTSLQIREISVNMSDKQSRTAAEGRSSKLAVGRKFSKLQQRNGSQSKYEEQLRTSEILTDMGTPFTQSILFKQRTKNGDELTSFCKSVFQTLLRSSTYIIPKINFVI